MKKHLKGFFTTLVSLTTASFLVAGMASAASTVGVDISTGGTLTAAGLTLLNGNASTTQLSSRKLYIGNSATTTILGDLGTSTFSGAIQAGCFSVDGTTCLTVGSGLASLNGLTLATQSFATGTADANITLSISSAGSTHTLTPGWAGSLAVARGGTGLTSVTNGFIFVGGPSNTVTQVATSSLGIITTNVAEGSNLYFTDPRARLATVGLFPATTSAHTWSSLQVFSSGFSALSSSTVQFLNATAATSTNFNVGSSLTVSGGTSTFSGAIQAGCFSVDGTTCLTSGGAGSQTPWTSNIFANSFALQNVGSLTATSAIITQATTTNFSIGGQFTNSSTATSSFAGGLSLAGGGLFISNGGLRAASLLSCDTVDTDASGTFVCGSDASSGGSSEINWTYFGGSGIRVSTTTNKVLIGGSSTTSTATLEVQGSQYVSGSFGVATTTPAGVLGVNGSTMLGGTLAVTGNASFYGTLNLAGATTTAVNGINLSDGCFAMGGTCISTSSGSGVSLGAVNTWTAQQIFPDIMVGAGTVGVDTSTAGELKLGTATATSITIGRAIGTTTFPGIVNITGSFTTRGVDASGGSALEIGTSTANAITIGRSVITTTMLGAVSLPTTVLSSGTLTLANSSTPIAGMVFGTCITGSSTAISAGSSKVFNCTTAVAVSASHRVFIQATSSPAYLVVQSASSTAGGVIGVEFFNASSTGSITPGTMSLNFLGVQ